MVECDVRSIRAATRPRWEQRQCWCRACKIGQIICEDPFWRLRLRGQGNGEKHRCEKTAIKKFEFHNILIWKQTGHEPTHFSAFRHPPPRCSKSREGALVESLHLFGFRLPCNAGFKGKSRLFIGGNRSKK